jgi:Actin
MLTLALHLHACTHCTCIHNTHTLLLQLGPERFTLGELLFDPKLHSACPAQNKTLMSMCEESLRSINDTKLWRTLLKNVVVHGVSAALPNLQSTLEVSCATFLQRFYNGFPISS